MSFIKLFIRSVDRLSEFVGRTVSICILGMMVVLVIEVIMRYFFKRPTLWAYDTSIFMFGYCGILAGAYTLKHNAHINVDVIYAKFSLRTRSILDVFTGLLFFYFMILMIIYCWSPAIIAIEGGHRGNTMWAPPIGHYRMLIVVGAVLLLLQGLANWLRALYTAITGKELEA